MCSLSVTVPATCWSPATFLAVCPCWGGERAQEGTTRDQASGLEERPGHCALIPVIVSSAKTKWAGHQEKLLDPRGLRAQGQLWSILLSVLPSPPPPWADDPLPAPHIRIGLTRTALQLLLSEFSALLIHPDKNFLNSLDPKCRSFTSTFRCIGAWSKAHRDIFPQAIASVLS